MRELKTFGGRSTFRYKGKVKEGTTFYYGNKVSKDCHISAETYGKLLAEFAGKTVKLGAVFGSNAPEGSLGGWLYKYNITQASVATYIGAILIAEGYAEKHKRSLIRFYSLAVPVEEKNADDSEGEAPVVKSFDKQAYEKYIFNPSQPNTFLAYNLLLKIIRDRDNLVFLDPWFFSEIFSKEIFDDELLMDIWDKPENFDRLGGGGKAEVYVKNYTQADFIKSLLRREALIDKHYLQNLFHQFICVDKVEKRYEEIEDDYGTTYEEFFWDVGFSRHDRLDGDYMRRLFPQLPELEEAPVRTKEPHNLVLFLTADYAHVAQHLGSDHTSILFTTLAHYPKIKPYISANVKPILFQEAEHIHLLFDHIRRDLRRNRKRKLTVNKPITQLSEVRIQGYFSIEDVHLAKLEESREIYFLGENGDGKTLLLQSMLLALRGNRNIGFISDFLKDNSHDEMVLRAADSNGEVYQFHENPKEKRSTYNNVFAYGVNRFRNDSDKKDKEGYLSLFSHEQYLENPIKWLQHLDYKESKGDISSISLEAAKAILNELLNENVKIKVGPDEVVFLERGSKVRFSQLSDGYKSVIVWTCDLIARLAENQPYVSELGEFKGIVLVDEIGIFLHPKWQYSIVGRLRNWFPNVQFIFTTHSPIIILGASKDALFYKVYKEEGVTKVSQAYYNQNLSHLMANGILTSPLFDLASARMASFDPKKQELDTSEDYLHSRIHKQLAQQLEQMKQDGRVYIAPEELDDMIDEVLFDDLDD